MLFDEAIMEEKFITRFIVPSITKEESALQDAAENIHLNLKQLTTAFHLGRLIPLSDNMWKSLENSDSWKTNSQEDLHGNCEKEWNLLMKAFKQNNVIEAPIVLELNGKYHLLSGDAKLMCMKVMKIEPQVYLITY